MSKTPKQLTKNDIINKNFGLTLSKGAQSLLNQAKQFIDPGSFCIFHTTKQKYLSGDKWVNNYTTADKFDTAEQAYKHMVQAADLPNQAIDSEVQVVYNK